MDVTSIRSILRTPYPYLLLYLAAAADIGIAHDSPSIFLFPAILVLFVAQAAVTFRISGPELFLPRLRKLILIQFPLILLCARNSFWPVFSDRYFAVVIPAAIIVCILYAWKHEVSEKLVVTLARWSFPAFAVLALSSRIDLIQFINEWRLMAEEGQVMAWVTRVSHGDVPFRDVIVTRGPFIIYTFSAVMHFFGENLVIKRAASLIVSIGMSYAYFYFCRRLFRSSYLAILSFMALILIRDPNYRTGFALLALAFFLDSLKERRSWKQVAAGFFGAVAVLSSVEVGVCSLAAMFGTSVIGILLYPRKMEYVRAAMLVLLGVLIVLLPPLLVFAAHGQLQDVVAGAILYPKYALLGYASSPYPNLLKVIRFDLEQHSYWFPTAVEIFVLWYVPVFIYLFSFFLLLRWWANRSTDRRLLVLLCVTVFGWLAYRSALGRTDYQHLYFCVGPAFVVAAMLADREKTLAVTDKRKAWLPIVMATLLPLLFLIQRPSDRLAPAIRTLAENLRGSEQIGKDYQPFEIEPLRGVLGPAPLRWRVESVVRVLNRYLQPGDRVYAFPNLPLYYFLLDSPNPTPFEWAYQAASHEMRLEVVHALEQVKPKYVIYSLDPRQRLDRIPAEVAIPEIVEYLDQHYVTWRTFGQEEIRVRK